MKPMTIWNWLLFTAAGALVVVLAALVTGPVVQAKPDPGTCDDLVLTVETDEAACASGSIQCNDEGSGHSHQAASAANHNPVMLVALVTRNGLPVTGLTASNFFFAHHFGPAGGPSVLLCPAGGTGCGGGADNLFKAAPNGTYIMFAHPGGVGVNWRAGSYFPTLQVILPDSSEARVLARMDIPPAP